jgi:uncharacterized linocin/CFP29 family protein
MDFLKKHLAPISEEAWEEIEEQAKISLKAHLSGRKFVDIDGPKGWDFPGKALGRLNLANTKKEDVNYGVRSFLPTIEARVPFTLKIWELDNATRGAEDVDLENLEVAAKRIATFEDSVIYNGLNKANIDGIFKTAPHKIKLAADSMQWLEQISEGIEIFSDNAIEGPFALVLNPKSWRALDKYSKGYPLRRQVKDLIGGPIIMANYLKKDGVLVSIRDDDLKLTIGQDFSIGYEQHDSENVKLFITETFTFQINEPNAIINLKTE